MATKFAVYWDNGASACGTFPDRFDTHEEAQAFAIDWVLKMDATRESDDEDGYSAEVIEVDESSVPDEEELFKREAWE